MKICSPFCIKTVFVLCFLSFAFRNPYDSAIVLKKGHYYHLFLSHDYDSSYINLNCYDLEKVIGAPILQLEQQQMDAGCVCIAQRRLSKGTSSIRVIFMLSFTGWDQISTFPVIYLYLEKVSVIMDIAGTYGDNSLFSIFFVEMEAEK